MWDDGFGWRLGAGHGGWRAMGSAATVALGVLALAEAAVVAYPGSEFAAWWRAT